MRYRDPKRLRIISGASVLLILMGLPVIVGFTRWDAGAKGAPPEIVTAYASGLSSLGLAGLAAAGLACLFGVWLFLRQEREVGSKHVHYGSRRRNWVEDARTVAVVLGAAGLIIGSLAGLYAAMIHARPDLAGSFHLPFLTAKLALSGLLGGGLLYAAGRLGR